MLKNSNSKSFKKILKELSNCSLIVLRVNAEGKLVNSKPCRDCTDQLKSLGIKNIYYSNNIGEISFEKIKKLETEHICRSKKIY